MENTVKLFMEVTKEPDENEATNILKSCEWNLEEAISIYLSKNEFEKTNKEYHSTTENLNNINKIDEIKEFEESIYKKNENEIEKKSFLYILNPIGKIIFPIFKNIYYAISTFFKLLSTFILTPYNDSNFTSYYENKYGKMHTNFFKGSLNEAILKSRKEEKLLLVYLHIDNNESAYFCEQVFNNSEIKSFFDENCILFAQDISKGDTKELQNVLNVFILPQISIILTCYVKDIKELTIIYGKPSVDHIINSITHCIEQMQVKKENSENLKHKTYNDRLIREQQDREYQEALKKDKLIEEEKKKKENEKLKKIQYKKEIKRKRQEKCKKFPLPIKENEQVTKISLRLSNGTRIQSNFSLDHTLEDIYEWAECCEFLEKNIKIPYKFELVCGHSKSTLQKVKNKIKEFDLYPNAVLNLKSLDTSDEE
ncbi:UBX domain, putative [Plasmodium relictum]|uniref:UBX domain, putative n=1 Tax=Plasmodium relictum TaxID=85471 RepID=A0A1J1H494_PLARL|nr:UBX domain, putative [Plasmodium relictum]CRG99562.1 UBX domain, putative [Plasmodium relictum]